MIRSVFLLKPAIQQRALVASFSKLRIAHPSVALPQIATYATASKKSTISSASKPKKASGSKSSATKDSNEAASKKTTATKEAAKKEIKLQPWDVIGPDGKLVPLPFEYKPSLTPLFFLYMADRMPHFKGHPEFQRFSTRRQEDVLDVNKITAVVGEEWRNMSADQKKKYQELHEKNKAQYLKEMDEWKASLSPEDIRRHNMFVQDRRKKGKKGLARLRDPAKPRRPPSAFILYLSELRSKGDLSGPAPEVAKKGGELWKKLSPEVKAPFEQQAQAANTQYKKDLEKYNDHIEFLA